MLQMCVELKWLIWILTEYITLGTLSESGRYAERMEASVQRWQSPLIRRTLQIRLGVHINNTGSTWFDKATVFLENNPFPLWNDFKHLTG